MRRYTILALTAFVLIMAAVAGMTFPVDADKKISGVPTAELTAYTTLPAETASILSEVYERENHVRVNFVPMNSNEIVQKIRDDSVSDPTVVRTVDIVLTDSRILRAAADLNLFTPYTSEAVDAVRDTFKDEQDRWTGIWYDPIVFCANKDFLRTTVNLPDTWEKLSKAGKIRVGVTDFLAADASSNLMMQMIANFGDAKTYEILAGIHPKVVQYAKFLSNPVRQAGMGEVDIVEDNLSRRRNRLFADGLCNHDEGRREKSSCREICGLAFGRRGSTVSADERFLFCSDQPADFGI